LKCPYHAPAETVPGGPLFGMRYTALVLSKVHQQSY
jgi:hypothetical protein